MYSSKMNPNIITTSKCLMSEQSFESFYHKMLRKLIAFIWLKNGRYGVRFNYSNVTGNIFVRFMGFEIVTYNTDGGDIKSTTRELGYECLVTPVMEFADDKVPKYYQISGYGPVRSISECLANIEIIKSMAVTIQSMGNLFRLESEKLLPIPQSELEQVLKQAIRFCEIDAVIQINKLQKTSCNQPAPIYVCADDPPEKMTIQYFE